MPTPTSPEIQSIASSALASRSLRGSFIPNLARTVGQTYGQALLMFMAQAVVLPGIASAVDPITGSGSTCGPGMLLAPPAGAPSAQQIESLVMPFLLSEQLNGERKRDLAHVIAQALAEGLRLFTLVRQVGPGIAVSGFATSAPGRLIGVGPSKAQLQPLVRADELGRGLRGAHSPELADALAETVAMSLDIMATRLLVLPGIACTPAATAAPGRLC